MADESIPRHDRSSESGESSQSRDGRTLSDPDRGDGVDSPRQPRPSRPDSPASGPESDSGSDGRSTELGPFGGWQGDDVLTDDAGNQYTARYLELARRDAAAGSSDNPDGLPGWSEHWVFSDPEFDTFGRF